MTSQHFKELVHTIKETTGLPIYVIAEEIGVTPSLLVYYSIKGTSYKVGIRLGAMLRKFCMEHIKGQGINI